MRVSAPGKLILMGEHAVVHGRPALVAAIDLRLTVSVSPAPLDGVVLDLPGLGCSEQHLSWMEVRDYARGARERWDRYVRSSGSFQEMRGEDPAHVVKAALGEAVEVLGLPDRGLRLRIDSGLPIGSGFGSSAATAVAVIAGALSWFGKTRIDSARIERLALEVERRQHGHPSGVDGATILRGGVLWARRSGSGELEIEPVGVRSPLLSRLRVYDTGTPPEATGAVVAAVRGLKDREPGRIEGVLDRIEAATAAFRAELEREEEDRDRALHLIRSAQAGLEELGVVPGEVRAAVREIEAAGGSAKVSGAGSLAGPGAGSLLVYHPDPGKLVDCDMLKTFPFYAVHLGAPGFRQEAAG